MKTLRRIAALAAVLAVAGAMGAAPVARAAIATPGAPAAPPASFRFGRFGPVALYMPDGRPKSVTLFVSGDGGWNSRVDAIARDLVHLGAMVVGVDAKHYLKAIDAQQQGCVYMAADFEDLSHEAQKHVALPDYQVPVIAGYSSGATLAYATLLQAPAGTFAGAMSLGFCADLPIHRPVCRSNALVAHDLPRGRGIAFDPQPKLSTPWIVLNGADDGACPTAAARNFVARTGRAEFVEVPAADYGVAADPRGSDALRASYLRLAAGAAPPKVAAAAVSDLPLVELPPKQGRAPILAVMLTGDGGWAGIDQDLAAELSRNGVGVVGFNTLKYFWKARPADEAAAALQRVIEHYATAWGAERVLLVGYSFGADALPFLYNRLAAPTAARVSAMALLGLSAAADFEIHVADWLPGPSSGRGQPTAPELGRIRQLPVLCITAKGDPDSQCLTLKAPNVTVREIGSGHHFGGEYGRIAQEVLSLAGR